MSIIMFWQVFRLLPCALVSKETKYCLNSIQNDEALVLFELSEVQWQMCKESRL